MIRGFFLFSYVLLTLWDTILHLDLSSFAYLCIGQIQIQNFAELSTYLLGIVWLPLFGAEIKEFIYDSNNYLFGCHGIGYGIYFIPNLNTYWVPCHLCRFAKMK
jgi:hypothetical protein